MYPFRGVRKRAKLLRSAPYAASTLSHPKSQKKWTIGMLAILVGYPESLPKLMRQAPTLHLSPSTSMVPLQSRMSDPTTRDTPLMIGQQHQLTKSLLKAHDIAYCHTLSCPGLDVFNVTSCDWPATHTVSHPLPAIYSRYCVIPQPSIH